jgi:hypothetical protein
MSSACCGVVLAAEEPDLLGLLEPDLAGEQVGAEAAVEAADLRAGLAEAGVVGGDGEVAHDVQDVAAADGPARHHGHDGFGSRRICTWRSVTWKRPTAGPRRRTRIAPHRWSPPEQNARAPRPSG